MKYVDFGIQSLLLLMGVVVTLASVIMGDKDWLFGILYMQLLLGPWQYVGSLLCIAAGARYSNERKTHFFISTLYLLLLIAGSKSSITQDLSGPVILVSLTVPACALALYYYLITWGWVFPRYKGQFLPHINF